MKYSHNFLVLVSLVLLPIKASALSCAMISIAESCDMLWYRPSGLDYNLCLESRKKQKMDEQAIENEWRSLFRERVALGRRFDRVSLSLNSKLQIEDVLQKIEKRLDILSPIYSEFRWASCLRWMD